MGKTLLAALVLASGLAAGVAAADTPIPQGACLPENAPQSGSWPVMAIYLHGWFPPSGPNDIRGSRALEIANRAALAELARRHRIRIAAPLALQVNASNGMLEWGDADLQQIERTAMQACRVAELPQGIAMIGFSNGGFKAHDLGQLPCEQLDRYSRILAVGTQAAFPDRCNGKFRNIPEHRFPPDNLDALLDLHSPPRLQQAEGKPAD
jgi:hypothetical protein